MSATQNAPANRGTVDATEVAKFEAMAAEWWDPHGKFKPLHMLNPCRLDYIVDQIAAEFGRDPKAPRPFAGLRLLDDPVAQLGRDLLLGLGGHACIVRRKTRRSGREAAAAYA